MAEKEEQWHHKSKKHGFSKGTLLYTKQNAKKNKSFNIYDKVWGRP